MSDQHSRQAGSGLRRLWTPWRLKYVAESGPEEGCIFCNRLAEGDDTKSLILRRSTNSFVIMNLYPYNTGHVMIVPNRHVADPAGLSVDELADFAQLLPVTLDALRRVLKPAGFNVGMNIGAVAGAGVADHLHQHIVPRWQGDANFMPILAGAMVVPELIGATYAKVRAEFVREADEAQQAVLLVVLSADVNRVLIAETGFLPCVRLESDEAVFDSGNTFLRSNQIDAELAGWAGPKTAAKSGPIALAYLSFSNSRPDGFRWDFIDDALQAVPSERERAVLNRALQLDLAIASAPPE